MSKEKNNDAPLGCMLLLTGLPVTIMVRAFVLVNLWGYFIVPLGVPQLGMAHLYGLCVMVAAIIPSVKNSNKDQENASFSEQAFVQIGSSVSVSLLLWAMGYMCYLFM